MPALFLACYAFSGDNFRVDDLGKGIWRIQAIQGTLSTVYVVEGKNEVLVIDACTGQEGLKEIVEKIAGSRNVKLTLTHGHFDHSGGMKYFTDVYMHVADTGLLPKDANTVRHYIDEGYLFDLGGRVIEVMSIPGHTPGSVAFYEKDLHYLFTGDGIGSTSVWAHISADPLTVYLASVKRLEGMKDKISEIFVGHHEQEKVKLTTQYITDMRMAAEGVLNGTLESTVYQNSFKSGRQATYGSATLIFNPDNLKSDE
jgi:glyoxylase-like metal-dependent hydrolase (beta-lactamase superfamily II)